MREYQVRICERLGVQFPGPTRQAVPMVASWPPAAIGATRRFDRGPANDRNRRKPATSLATYECGIKRNAVSVEEIERHARSLSE
jgi:hypothetical protein